MDQVIRQRDHVYKTVFNSIRNGIMDGASVDFILKKYLENMNIMDCAHFENESLHLMSTWDIPKECYSQIFEIIKRSLCYHQTFV